MTPWGGAIARGLLQLLAGPYLLLVLPSTLLAIRNRALWIGLGLNLLAVGLVIAGWFFL